MSLLLSLVLSLSLPSVQQGQFEAFDEPGAAWAGTLFPVLIVHPNTGVTREPLSVELGAPDTDPPLPINAGGDAEGRFFEALSPTAGTFALTASTPENLLRNSAMSAVVAFGVTDSFGSQSIGLLLRVQQNPHPVFGSGIHAYTAYLLRTPALPSQLDFAIARWEEGVVSSQFALASFPVGVTPENYVIEFQAKGRQLSAWLWRIRAQGGKLVTEPVALAGGVGPLANQLEAQDASLSFGRAGMYAFTRGTNSVFCDDVLVYAEDGRRHFGSSARFDQAHAPGAWRGWRPTRAVASLLGLQFPWAGPAWR